MLDSRTPNEPLDWPKVLAVVDADGAAEVTINGVLQTLRADGVDAARRAVIDHVATGTAAVLERPVKMEVTDPHGSWLLVVHPDGEVEALADAPAPRRKRRVRPIGTPARSERPAPATPPAPAASNRGLRVKLPALPRLSGGLRPSLRQAVLAAGVASVAVIGALGTAATRTDHGNEPPATASAAREPATPPAPQTQAGPETPATAQSDRAEPEATPSGTERRPRTRKRRSQPREPARKRQRARRTSAAPRPRPRSTGRPVPAQPAPPAPQAPPPSSDEFGI